MAGAMNPRLRRACAAAATLVLVAGCAGQPPRYAWGTYEDQLYTAWAKPGVLSPEQQIEQLEKDREIARAANQKLPPGWHAHLAYLYQQAGRADLAHEELLAEKTAYPEATALVDRLTTNMVGRPPSSGSPSGGSAR
jgi:hypothetical protein